MANFAILQFLRQVNQRNLSVVFALVTWAAFVLTSYAIGPQTYLASLASVALVLFFMATWISYSVAQHFPEQIQSLFWLKLRQPKFLFVWVGWFCLLFNSLLVLFAWIVPWFMYLTSHGSFFKMPDMGQTLTGQTAIFGLLLLLGILPSGIALGLLFQKIHIFSKRVTLLLLVLIALIGGISDRIQQSWPPFKYILWLFPPIGPTLQPFATAADTNWGKLAILWGWNLGYCLILYWLLFRHLNRHGLIA